jgi:rubrerythrin
MSNKKFFRCHVCNDIHLGFNYPKTCPTCLVENVYIEIEKEEFMHIAKLF